MEITYLGSTKRGRVSIHLDGEFYTTLHADVALPAGLASGQDITPARMVELEQASMRRDAKERALRLLSQRGYTRKGLVDKLCERVDEEAAEAAVDRMEELGLIDDRDWAQRFSKDCMERRGFSKKRTEQELRRKGIDRELAREVLDELDEDPELAIAAIVRRKYLRHLDDEKGLRRTQNALLRLGYRHNDIRAVIAHLQEDEDYYTQE